jgi:oligoendopeptidase F
MKRLTWIGLFVLSIMTVAVGAALAADGAVPERKDIEAKYKWALEDIYPTDQAWEADFQKFQAAIPEIAQYKGKLGESGETLLAALETRDRLGELHGKLFVYASMRYDQDTRVDLYAGMRDRISSLGVQYAQAAAYMEPEILAVPRDALWAMVEKTPGLELYRHYLDDLIRGQAHTLSAEEEELLALSSDVSGTFGKTFGAFHNADLTVYGRMPDEDGNVVDLTKARYSAFQESPDRRVREQSWKLFYAPYEEFGHMMANNMAGNVKSHTFYAKARKYDSALQAALDRNAIPTEVYTNLVKTVRENIEPLHRYVALRKRMLGVDTLQVWDMSAPLVTGTVKDIPFETAEKMVVDGLKPLGPEYLTPFRNAFNAGWIDVYETAGKRSGAYSWGDYDTKPYLLLNYNGTLEDVFTLAHEMGHSMHSYLTRHNQPYVYGDYATFVAEVASTTNEALLIHKMLGETTDHQKRLVLLNHYLEQIRGTFFTQVMFADFELQMHEMVESGKPLTKESLDQLYIDTYKTYFGPSVNVVDLNGATWSRIPHFYYNFYVYQYATSYAAATALSGKILKEGEPAVDRYLAYLKSGSSDYPINVLKKAGVDMTTPQPIVDTINTFSDVLDQMEAELDKSGE